MHTAICAFEDRARAEQAVDDLVRSGFARHDLHIEHKDLATTGQSGTGRLDGMEREAAVDHGRLSSVVDFFGDLFSHRDLRDQVDLYSEHVQGGRYVLVADAQDEAEAQRARAVLGATDASHVNVVHRPELTPLRDLVARRGEAGRAGMVDRPSDVYEGSAAPLERERAFASNRLSPTAGPDLRDPEVEHAPGLRYADKDKPL